MNWKLGQWLECTHTQEKGESKSYNGKTICMSLGEGVTLYSTPEALENLGWKPIRLNQNSDNS